MSETGYSPSSSLPIPWWVSCPINYYGALLRQAAATTPTQVNNCEYFISFFVKQLHTAGRGGRAGRASHSEGVLPTAAPFNFGSVPFWMEEVPAPAWHSARFQITVSMCNNTPGFTTQNSAFDAWSWMAQVGNGMVTGHFFPTSESLCWMEGNCLSFAKVLVSWQIRWHIHQCNAGVLNFTLVEGILDEVDGLWVQWNLIYRGFQSVLPMNFQQ